MVLRMGYSGFPEFRKSVMAELTNEQKASPLARMSNINDGAGEVKTYVQTIQNIQATFANLEPQTLDQASSLLADTRYRLTCIGGRFTGTLTTLFARHLKNNPTHAFMS